MFHGKFVFQIEGKASSLFQGQVVNVGPADGWRVGFCGPSGAERCQSDSMANSGMKLNSVRVR
jgi:hypothetical protein